MDEQRYMDVWDEFAVTDVDGILSFALSLCLSLSKYLWTLLAFGFTSGFMGKILVLWGIKCTKII